MKFDVYIIITKKINRYVTYVGYAKEIEKRILFFWSLSMMILSNPMFIVLYSPGCDNSDSLPAHIQ